MQEKMTQPFSDPICTAKIRSRTRLPEKCNKVTRLSSTSHMLESLLELREHLPKVEDEDEE